jgi:hypothetical protein
LSKDNTLSTYENFYIRKNIAMNQNTPPEALTILAGDTNEYDVRRYVAMNQNTPLEALILLSKDPDEYVRDTVAQNPTYIKYLESNKDLSKFT